MRNPDRIDITIDKLRELWKLTPDLRFGQILYSFLPSGDCFYWEEDRWNEWFDMQIKNQKILNHEIETKFKSFPGSSESSPD